MLRAISFVLGLLVLPVILIVEACRGGFKPATILAVRLLGLRARPWDGLLAKEDCVGMGLIVENCYWLAFPANVAAAVPWASGFHVTPADYFFAHNDITDPDFALVHRAVLAARAAHPGCVIFLATPVRDTDDPDPPVPPRVRVLRCTPQLGEQGGGARKGLRGRAD